MEACEKTTTDSTIDTTIKNNENIINNTHLKSKDDIMNEKNNELSSEKNIETNENLTNNQEESNNQENNIESSNETNIDQQIEVNTSALPPVVNTLLQANITEVIEQQLTPFLESVNLANSVNGGNINLAQLQQQLAAAAAAAAVAAVSSSSVVTSNPQQSLSPQRSLQNSTNTSVANSSNNLNKSPTPPVPNNTSNTSPTNTLKSTGSNANNTKVTQNNSTKLLTTANNSNKTPSLNNLNTLSALTQLTQLVGSNSSTMQQALNSIYSPSQLLKSFNNNTNNNPVANTNGTSTNGTAANTKPQRPLINNTNGPAMNGNAAQSNQFARLNAAANNYYIDQNGQLNELPVNDVSSEQVNSNNQVNNGTGSSNGQNVASLLDSQILELIRQDPTQIEQILKLKSLLSTNQAAGVAAANNTTTATTNSSSQPSDESANSNTNNLIEELQQLDQQVPANLAAAVAAAAAAGTQIPSNLLAALQNSSSSNSNLIAALAAAAVANNTNSNNANNNNTNQVNLVQQMNGLNLNNVTNGGSNAVNGNGANILNRNSPRSTLNLMQNYQHNNNNNSNSKPFYNNQTNGQTNNNQYQSQTNNHHMQAQHHTQPYHYNMMQMSMQQSQPTHNIHGQPQLQQLQDYHEERFSRKVFVGGLPPDIDEDEIVTHFRRYGNLIVDWPHKAESKSYFPPKGYAFLIFQDERSVQDLIETCVMDDGKLYMVVSSPSMKDKPVQIRPWCLADSDFVMDGSQPLDPRKTIFVGGVPRPLKAIELAMIMDRFYGGVCYAGIDTDPELKYPKGAGRVAFSNQQSYIAAISARFVQLQHGEIDKRVEVKPYVLDDQMCDECQGARCGGKFAPFFCANVTCLQYYCEACWATIHTRPGREYHKPLVKEGADRPRPIPYK
jgi:cytoplasmic polyadenylation element-binding protein